VKLLEYRDFIENSETETETRDLKFETETSKFGDFAKIFQKTVAISSQLNFFEFLAFFRSVLVVSYLHIKLTTNSLNYKGFAKPFLCDMQTLQTIGCDRDL